MKKFKYLIFIMCFFHWIIYGYTTATVESVAGVRNFVSGVESVFNNPAFITNIKGNQSMLDYKKYFFVSSEQNVDGYTPADISNILFATKFDLGKNFGCGLGIGSLIVPNFYNETKFVFAGGYKHDFEIVKFFIAGQVSSKFIDFFSSEYDKTKKFYINTYIAIEYKNFVFTIIGEKIFKKTEDDEPVEFISEITYKWFDKIFASFGLQTGRQIEPKLGVEWRLKESLFFRSGINNNEFSLGFGIKIKKISLNISSVYPYNYFQPLPQVRTAIVYNW